MIKFEVKGTGLRKARILASCLPRKMSDHESGDEHSPSAPGKGNGLITVFKFFARTSIYGRRS